MHHGRPLQGQPGTSRRAGRIASSGQSPGFPPVTPGCTAAALRSDRANLGVVRWINKLSDVGYKLAAVFLDQMLLGKSFDVLRSWV